MASSYSKTTGIKTGRGKSAFHRGPFTGKTSYGQTEAEKYGAGTRTIRKRSLGQISEALSRPGRGVHVGGLSQQALRGAAGKGRITETRGMPQRIGLGNYMQRVTRTEEPSVTRGTLTQAALGDLGALASAKAEKRGLAQVALGRVERGYGGAVQKGQEAVVEAKQEGRAAQEQAMSRTQEVHEGARDYARGVGQRMKSRTDLLTEQAEQRRTEAIGSFRSQAALDMNATRLGMERRFQQQMDELEDQAAQGNLPPQQLEQAKAQQRLDYTAQLGGVASQLAQQQEKLSAQVRQQADELEMQTKQQAAAAEGATGARLARVMGSLAESESQATARAMADTQQFELGLLQSDLAVQQMRIAGAETEAELLTSPAMAPTAIMSYPVMKDLYNVYATEASYRDGQRMAIGGSSDQGGLNTGFNLSAALGGGPAGGQEQGGQGGQGGQSRAARNRAASSRIHEANQNALRLNRQARRERAQEQATRGYTPPTGEQNPKGYGTGYIEGGAGFGYKQQWGTSAY